MPVSEWIVPFSDTYTIIAYGAQGGPAGHFDGGLGAMANASFYLNINQD